MFCWFAADNAIITATSVAATAAAAVPVIE